MGVSLLNNQAAVGIRRELEVIERDSNRAMERLATGKRINNVYDDPAGLAISSLLRAKIRGLQQAQRNAMDAVSLIQVAEGGLNELDNLVGRLRELAVQSSSDTVTDEERQLLQTEFTQLRDEIERIAQSTRYLGNALLNGSQREMVFQIGVENTDSDRITYDTGSIDVTASSLGLEDLTVEDADSALDSLESLDEAIRQIHSPRAYLGGVQSRLHSLTSSLALYEENLTAAHGRIHDADYARETTEFFRTQLQQKAALGMLAQANQQPAAVLKLLDPGV